MNEIPSYIESQGFTPVLSNFHINHYFLSAKFPLHRHDFVELRLVAGGEGTEILNGVEYKLKEGSISVTLPWHSHEICPNPDAPLEMYKCWFNTSLFLDFKNPFFELSDLILKSTVSPPIITLSPEDFVRVKGLFTDIMEEYSGTRLWKDVLIKAKVAEVLIYFERSRDDSIASEDKQPENRQHLDIWKVVEYLHLYVNEDISINTVAEYFHYDPSYLNKMLKQQVGLNFENMLQEIRIRKACAYLAFPMAEINQIASAVGFKSQESFFRAFKSIKGTSPEQYRKLYIERDTANRFTTFSVLYAQIIYYMHMHYSENITLASLAKEFHYNETYLCNILKENGVSFLDLLHEIRVYHACDLLLTGDLPVNEVGFQVGFDSTETFYRSFKKLRNLSPGEYRNTNKKK